MLMLNFRDFGQTKLGNTPRAFPLARASILYCLLS